MFKLTITTRNAAFHEPDGDFSPEARGAEVARILRKLAGDLESGSGEGILFDANGNRVGAFQFGEE